MINKFISVIVLHLFSFSLYAQANYMFLDIDLLNKAMEKYTYAYTYVSKTKTGTKNTSWGEVLDIYKYTYKLNTTSLLYHFYTVNTTIICLEIEGNRKDLRSKTNKWVAKYTRPNQYPQYSKGAYYYVPDAFNVAYVYHVYTPPYAVAGKYRRYLSINEEILHNDILR